MMIRNRTSTAQAAGGVARLHQELADQPGGLLGYVMRFGCDDGVIITNDYYTLRAGGVARNAFVLIRPSTPRPQEAQPGLSPADAVEPPVYLVLARVREPAADHLSSEQAHPYLSTYRSIAPDIDESRLEWRTMHVSILGTFYDDPETGAIAMAGDVEVFLSPLMYTVHMPSPATLERLLNVFVGEDGWPIGRLRLTESRLIRPAGEVPVRISPADFIGARTGIFGKAGTGKARAARAVVEAILASGRPVGQIVFDRRGRYTYGSPEGTALHERHPRRTLRYSLRPEPGPGVRVLKVNFYTDVALGHRIITELYSQQVGTPAQYEIPFLNWEVLSEGDLAALEKVSGSAATRYRRQRSIYLCVLHAAGFEHDPEMLVDLHLKKSVREAIASLMPSLGQAENDHVIRVPRSLPVEDAAAVFTRAWELYQQGSPVFVTRSGLAYFDDTAASLLTILTQRTATGNAVSGFRKFQPFQRYHSPHSGLLLAEVIQAADAGKTVILDLSNAARDLAGFFASLIAKAVFNHQMSKFTDNVLGEHYVQFVLEDAHELLPAGPSRSVYHRLAEEGEKLHIGLVYTTPHPAALSATLLTATQNLLVAHLDDQREVDALTRFHAFRDLGPDIQRTRAPGFMRMLTRSHRFAVPVQVQPPGEQDPQR